MKKLILRKCRLNGISSHGFCYGNVGDVVTAPDWDPTPKCGGGLHGLLEADGEWLLLEGQQWLVIEADEKDIVRIGDDKCKFRTGKILYRGNKIGLRKFTDRMAFTSRAAYRWASIIGHKSVLRNRVTESRWAYHWAMRFPKDRHIMRDRVTESSWAFRWAMEFPEDRSIMRDRITGSELAFWWVVRVGDLDIMRSRITESKWVKELDSYLKRFNVKEKQA